MHVSLINSITCGGSMGALIEVEGNGAADTEKSRADKICASSPVVYQLVRVIFPSSLQFLSDPCL